MLTTATTSSARPGLRAVRARDPRARGVHIRPLRRDDGDLLDAVMAGMGTRSRYQRFHAPKPRLTPSDRAYLTSADGRDHIALIALAPGGAPLGVARAVRLKDDPGAAEMAVALVDARQGEGLGSDLTARIARLAAGAGIERLVARVLAQSRLADALARRGWRLTEQDGPVLSFSMEAWRLAARAGGA